MKNIIFLLSLMIAHNYLYAPILVSSGEIEKIETRRENIRKAVIALCNQKKCAQEILDKPFEQFGSLAPLTEMAFDQKNIDLFNRLLNLGATPTEEALYFAVVFTNTRAIKKLLSVGVKPDDDACKALDRYKHFWAPEIYKELRDLFDNMLPSKQ